MAASVGAQRELAELAPAGVRRAHQALAAAGKELLDEVQAEAPQTLDDLQQLSNDAVARLERKYGDLTGETDEVVAFVRDHCGFEVSEATLTRDDLYIADEMFTCGTAAEVGSVRSVDDREIACPGPITTAVAEAYSRATRGEDPRYLHWVETCR
jgi:hypothetical protein